MTLLTKATTKITRLIKRFRYELQPHNDKLKAPIFIVGSGHSGTSLLLSMLSSHKHIYGVPNETSMAKKDKLHFLIESHKHNSIAIAEEKRRWVEKTPSHILFLDQIFKWNKNAKIIIIIRDGRDVAASWKKRKGSALDGIDIWLKLNLAGKKYWNHPNVHTCKYEDLISSPKSVITNILGFIEEEYEESVLNYHEKEKYFYSDTISKPEDQSDPNHDQYRNWQINQPIFDGRGRWKELSTKELDEILAKSSSLLTELKYI